MSALNKQTKQSKPTADTRKRLSKTKVSSYKASQTELLLAKILRVFHAIVAVSGDCNAEEITAPQNDEDRS